MVEGDQDDIGERAGLLEQRGQALDQSIDALPLLDLGHEPEAGRLRVGQDLAQARQALAGELRGEPAAGVERGDLGGGLFRDRPAAVADAVEDEVMGEQDLVVLGQHEIDLAAGGAGLPGHPQRGQRVLGGGDAVAAMAADVDEAVLAREQAHGRSLC